MNKNFHPDTIAIHGGQKNQGNKNFPIPDLVLNSAIPLESLEEGWEMLTKESIDNFAYQRYENPTVRILEEKFKEMEGSTYALAINSGMTACYLIFRALLTSGDHILSQHSLYHEISDQIIEDKVACGIDYTLIDEYSNGCFERNIQNNTKVIFVETPTNPTMKDVDLPALSHICRKHGIILVVDNTLLTHELQKPLSLGAHVAVYSTTKTINGHGDAMGGLITTNDNVIYKKIKQLRENTGQVLDPFSAWLTIRGMRTLRLRLNRHTENALKVIEFLQAHYPKLEVRYPLHSQNSLQNKVTHGGGVISIVFDNKDMGTEFIRNLKLLKIATTFGNLESLCYHFGTFTRPHRDLSKIGLPEGLVRLSIGIEDANDIIHDIDQSLKALWTE